jgi:hypothetical protein
MEGQQHFVTAYLPISEIMCVQQTGKLKKNENIKALIYLLILNINLINQILNLII